MASAIEPRQEATPEWRPQRSGRTTSRRRVVTSQRLLLFHWTEPRSHLSKQDRALRLIFTSWPGRVGMEWTAPISSPSSSACIHHQRLCHARSGCGNRNCNGPGSRGQPATRCLRPSLTTPMMSLTSATTAACCSASSMSFAQISACTDGGTPAPSLDGNWGTAGGLATGCTGKLTGAVVDGGTGNIFVGCSDGKLYGFTLAGAALPGSPLTVGNGAATGGIVDPPMMDAVNGFVYVVSGNSAGGTSVMVQAKHDRLEFSGNGDIGCRRILQSSCPSV